MLELQNEIRKRAERVERYMLSDEHLPPLSQNHLREAVLAYPSLKKKMLRPAVLLISCAAVGGDEEVALPAAAAVEMFHTWTLVHDDIIDHDTKRRGADTVHERFRKRALEELGLSPDEAREYGTAMGILAGDMQHGWAVEMLSRLLARGTRPEVVVELVSLLDGEVLRELIGGQLDDLVFARREVEAVSESMILGMLSRKTGKLYSYAARAGAMVGLNSLGDGAGWIAALGQFFERAAVAFQIQDDVLGITGDEKILGKSVGSDIREGKKTLPLLYAFGEAAPAEKDFLRRVVGNVSASAGEIGEARSLINHRGGIERAMALALRMLDEAERDFRKTALPSLPHRELLIECGRFMVERNF